MLPSDAAPHRAQRRWGVLVSLILPPPPARAAPAARAGGGGRMIFCGVHTPRAHTLGYTHVAPLGLNLSRTQITSRLFENLKQIINSHLSSIIHAFDGKTSDMWCRNDIFMRKQRAGIRRFLGVHIGCKTCNLTAC